MGSILPRSAVPLALGADQATEPERRQVKGYPAAEPHTPSKVAFSTGVAYGVWGVHMSDVGRLSLLAQELAAHVAERTLSDSLLVVAEYDAGFATVYVIALGGTVRRPLDPGSLRHVRETDTAGVALFEVGLAAYVRVGVRLA
ncbi:hypothetical protein [Streptomyces sp. NPDC048623]|uniref:hypothetical protein n=1 Tax=Streptomyces sp. NPDC048623 TaxID=3155761 RepID=UPI003435164E